MYRALVESPIGDILIEGNDDGITRLGRVGPNEPSEGCFGIDRFAAIKEAARQLDAYWSGELFDFDLPMAASGTPFQHRVWSSLQRIPYGTTVSYGRIASEIGSPKAVRAVGAANGRNPIAIVVPCHRVIGANGKLTGYAGGLDMKQLLLEHEARYVHVMNRPRSDR